jgi:hypothetical protein
MASSAAADAPPLAEELPSPFSLGEGFTKALDDFFFTSV